MQNKLLHIFSSFLILLSIVSCKIPLASSGKYSETVSIISWNLQTFFDSVTQGTEYDEFKGEKSTWTKEKYNDRLLQLCDFIETQDADIYAFSELENIEIIQDISNNLSTRSIMGTKYKYACFAKNPNGVFGCGVISKYPLKNLKLHNIDYRQEVSQPELRPLLEVTAQGAKGTEFTLFVCHWKSKSGGAKETDLWRDKQENLLVDCIKKSTNEHIIACGDFNRDLLEFNIDFSDNSVCLRGYKESQVKMKNPWLVTNHKGSYNFNGQWNKIDHFFFSDKIKLLSFGTIKEYTNQEGLPMKYSVRSGSGYSDHLPIMSYVVLQ